MPGSSWRAWRMAATMITAPANKIPSILIAPSHPSRRPHHAQRHGSRPTQGGPRRSRPGMPAWSDHSDEDLWATVAFLLAALGHLGAIVSVITKELRGRQYYRA